MEKVVEGHLIESTTYKQSTAMGLMWAHSIRNDERASTA